MSPVGQALAEIQRRFPDAQSVLVAYSGGRDSHVLLHSAVRFIRLPVRAVHIHHGLQAAAEHWPAHCEQVCAALDIPLEVVKANVQACGQGVEAAARLARYQAFEQQLKPTEILLLAHHAEDQAETLMLRLLRGSGLRGMAAMPEQRALGCSTLWRPLLNLNSSQLGEYAVQQQLNWIEDPSNSQLEFDRNYLRQEVMPRLASRWPQVARQLSSAARRAQDAENLLAELLAPVLDKLVAPDGSLCCEGLLQLPESQHNYLLRAWWARQHELAPTEAQLQAVLNEVVRARRDADPRVQIQGAEVRRHRDRLYRVELHPFESPSEFLWSDLAQPLQFAGETLSMESEFGQKLQIPAGAKVRLRVRSGGERMRLRGGERPLKKVMQDLSLPSWLRDRTPLLYVDDELAAIWNFSIAVKYQKTQ